MIMGIPKRILCIFYQLNRQSIQRKIIIGAVLLLLLQLSSSIVFAAEQGRSIKQSVATVQPTLKDEALFSLPQDAQKALKENVFVPKTAKKELIPAAWWHIFFNYFFLGMLLTGVIPVVIFFIEHNLSGLHAFSNHFNKCKDYYPKIAVIIPAWNEALVLEHTIDILLKMDYPHSSLRLYIIDDGSTDDTAELLEQMRQKFPENVIHVRKEAGGKGKAHAVNYGLEVVLSNDWAEALLFIDADISFKKDALRRLARHLADPEVGAVTGYIKVGNRDTNYISRSIGYEYIVSQSVARRAQNVLGVVACLAGGAQLHTRENIIALGGAINTTTLAEDTYTTLATQKLGKKVIYEGNCFVYAEEPTAILDLWKQRFRWARGNLQITKAFKDIWFSSKHPNLGRILFGIIWFSVVLTPVLMLTAAIGFLGLYLINREYSFHIFFFLTSISLFVYLYTTILAIIVDRKTSRQSWFEGIVYPGLISLSTLVISINPDFFFKLIASIFDIENKELFDSMLLLFMGTWSGLCMLWAWVVFRLEYIGVSPRITNVLLIIVGYGPLLCTINLAAYIAEIKKPNMKWDKTEKVTSKRVIRPRDVTIKKFDFDKELRRDIQREYRFFIRELYSLAVVCFIFLLIYGYI